MDCQCTSAPRGRHRLRTQEGKAVKRSVEYRSPVRVRICRESLLTAEEPGEWVSVSQSSLQLSTVNACNFLRFGDSTFSIFACNFLQKVLAKNSPCVSLLSLRQLSDVSLFLYPISNTMIRPLGLSPSNRSRQSISSKNISSFIVIRQLT